jgi:hypothetical protein
LSDVSAEDIELLAAKVRVPDHVAIREFADESVALNLNSGSYYGLNPVAARMFELLKEVSTPQETVDSLATDYGQERGLIQQDLAALLRQLIERGLVELETQGD